MTNYYKQFESFKKQFKFKKDIPLEQFEHELMVFFGFGGRNKTLKRWLNNFVNVKFIDIKQIMKINMW